MDKVFSHPWDIPVFRALAVHSIMHNDAGQADWDTMDEWVTDMGLDHVVNDVIRIIEMNAPDTDFDAERKWWTKELTAHSHTV